MEKPFNLAGKVALITGSMSGIGLDTAKLFLKQNLKALILLDIVENGSILEELKNTSNGTQIVYRKCDVSDETNLVEAYNYAWNSFGYIHVAVHSAGINDEDNSRRMICINVAGVIDGSMWLWNKMRQNGGGEGGTIINISSIAGMVTAPITPIYSATKHAVRNFGESLGNSFNYNETGVRVVTVCPGLTRTTMTSIATLGIYGSVNEELEKVINALSFQKSESVAKVILEVCRQAESGTVWVSSNDLPAEQYLPRDDQAIFDAYLSK